mmetsp:Transcript_11801/g.25146  ORF Transcript_11801/g.25146 Transcript_11801/m.25146 type:complete len:807 (+) Transcript_11801:56-2476(+)
MRIFCSSSAFQCCVGPSLPPLPSSSSIDGDESSMNSPSQSERQRKKQTKKMNSNKSYTNQTCQTPLRVDTLIGMALPCTGSHYINATTIDDDTSHSSSDVGASSSRDHPTPTRRRRNNKPFASSPLLDRGDSLVQRQASLLSLIATDTMETTGDPTDSMLDANDVTPTTTPRKKNNTNSRFSPRGEATSTSKEDERKKLIYATPIRSNAARISTGSRGRNSRGHSSSPTALPPDSPAMELSMAKQVANRAQMSNVRRNNRETLRNYRAATPTRATAGATTPMKNYLRGDSNSSSNSTGSSNDSSGNHSLGPPKLSSQGNKVEGTIMSTNKAFTGNENAATTRRGGDITPYACFENAGIPPVFCSAAEGVNSELDSTYEYPRLYLRHPTQIIPQTAGGAGDQSIGGLWWFHLAQRVETTLKHVQDDHWKALLNEYQQQSRNSMTSKNTTASFSSDSISATSSLSAQHQQINGFGACVAGLEQSDDGCVAMRDLCLGKPQGQLGYTPQNNGTSTAMKPTTTPSKSKHKHKSKKGRTKPSTNTALASPTNVWSEPSASTMKVRGRTYSKDGIKVESDTSMFAVLGVDSFVHKKGGGGGGDVVGNGGGYGGAGDGTTSSASSTADTTLDFLRRWTNACMDMGLEHPPFLLIINFIVPWGKFQAYFFRPEADDGPFVSRYRNRPSEKALREFIGGTTEYRNKRLKFIPRICAGPWMVKKMVGSTPALIGTKLPVSYRGSIRENFLEINLDVTKGPSFGNSVAMTVVGKADVVTVDLGFVIEGQGEDGHLPEQMLGLVRLHHLDMKKAPPIV